MYSSLALLLLPISLVTSSPIVAAPRVAPSVVAAPRVAPSVVAARVAPSVVAARVPAPVVAPVVVVPSTAASVIVAAPIRLGDLSSDTENDLTDGSACKAVTIIFARGTIESGNVGSLAGPPWFEAVANDIGAENLAVQGVDYPASIVGFLEGGDADGSALMANLSQQAQTQCPDTKLVLGGYSQGGQLVHNAASTFSASLTAFVQAVVIFGDPDDGHPVGSIPASKVDIICHSGDNICAGGDLVLPTHLTYSEDADSAAAFVASHTGYA